MVILSPKLSIAIHFKPFHILNNLRKLSKIIKLILVTLCVVCMNSYYSVSVDKVVLCYYGTWATYRYGLGKFDVSNINPHLCTHIAYAFAGVNLEGTVISLNPHLDLADHWGQDNFRDFNSLKLQNTNLKTLLSVGGWDEGSAKYSIMAANPKLRKNFIRSALNLLLNYGFDGLDIDWEYPNQRDTVHGEADVNNYTQLLKELKEEFEKYDLLLTAAVPAVKYVSSSSYDIPSIAKYLDLINLMSYDMNGASRRTGHNAPLHKGESDKKNPKYQTDTVDNILKHWLEQGVPPEKLVLGLPFYGHTFLLANARRNGVRAKAKGPGIAGPYTATKGSIGYNEFCHKLRTESWEQRYDSLAKVPYAVQGKNWVSYDDASSLETKIEYALKLNVSGVMIWSIETDDFHGICHTEDFPLLKAVNRALGKLIESSTATAFPVPPTVSPSISHTTVHLSTSA